MTHQHDDVTIPLHLGPARRSPEPTGARRALVLAAGVVAAFVAVFGGRTLLDAAGSALLG